MITGFTSHGFSNGPNIHSRPCPHADSGVEKPSKASTTRNASMCRILIHLKEDSTLNMSPICQRSLRTLPCPLRRGRARHQGTRNQIQDAVLQGEERAKSFGVSAGSCAARRMRRVCVTNSSRNEVADHARGIVRVIHTEFPILPAAARPVRS